jgi:integrase
MSTHRISVRKDREMVQCFKRGKRLWLNYNLDGKRYRKPTGLDDNVKNRKLVQNTIIPQLLTKITTGEIYKKKSKLFEFYGEIYLKQKEKTLRAYHTRLPYFRRVIEHFKGRNIDKITRLDIKDFLLSLNMKSISKRSYKSCINEIFELAVDDGILYTNPALNIRLPKDVKQPVQYFYKYEVEKLLSVATGIMKPYLLLAFNTGMRPEEILGLQFTDIKDKILSISRVRTKGRVDYPKTNNSFRKLAIPQFVIDEIEILKSDSLYLFGDIDDASKLRRKWLKVISDADIDYKRISCARHTFATLMLQEKIVSLNELSGLLGHSSPKVTLAHYSGVIDSSLIDLGEDFALFGHNTDTMQKEKFQIAH